MCLKITKNIYIPVNICTLEFAFLLTSKIKYCLKYFLVIKLRDWTSCFSKCSYSKKLQHNLHKYKSPASFISHVNRPAMQTNFHREKPKPTTKRRAVNIRISWNLACQIGMGCSSSSQPSLVIFSGKVTPRLLSHLPFSAEDCERWRESQKLRWLHHPLILLCSGRTVWKGLLSFK